MVITVLRISCISNSLVIYGYHNTNIVEDVRYVVPKVNWPIYVKGSNKYIAHTSSLQINYRYNKCYTNNRYERDATQKIYGYRQYPQDEFIWLNNVTTGCEIKLKDNNITVVNELSENIRLRKLYFDIECISHNNSFPNANDVYDPIWMISCVYVDRLNRRFNHLYLWCKSTLKLKGNNYIIHRYSSELDMLKQFVEDIKNVYKPDVILGYNILDFDLPYLEQRLKVKTIYDINTCFVLDLYPYAKSKNIRPASLNNVAKVLLNKVKLDMPYLELFSIFYKQNDSQVQRVCDYCMVDSELCYLIDSKSKACDEYYALAVVSKTEISVVASNHQCDRLNNYIAHITKDQPILLLQHVDVTNYKVRGALNVAYEGIYRDCAYYDFKSLYPSCCLSYFISPDNLVYHHLLGSIDELDKFISRIQFKLTELGELENHLKIYSINDNYILVPFESNEQFGLAVFKQQPGIFQNILSTLISKRAAIQKKEIKTQADDGLQYAYKILANSLTGLASFSSFVLYSPVVLGCITYVARGVINRLQQHMIEQSYRVAYVDTDSVVIHGVNDDKVNVLLKQINDYMTNNTKLGKFVVALEKKLELLWVAGKKNYAALDHDHLSKSGMQNMGSIYPSFYRGVHVHVFKQLARGTKVNTIMKYISNMVQLVNDGEVPLNQLATTYHFKPGKGEPRTNPSKVLYQRSKLLYAADPNANQDVLFLPILMSNVKLKSDNLYPLITIEKNDWTVDLVGLNDKYILKNNYMIKMIDEFIKLHYVKYCDGREEVK